MDVNKLKSRLNVKFQPLKGHKKPSLKKLQKYEKQKDNNDDSIIGRARSISQVRLPSIKNQSKIRHDTLEDSRSYVNVAQLRQKTKSLRQIPKVIESKTGINSTITYLMKNQILTVPRIVALLQKNQSDQFLYFKIVGMYQFEACSQKDKGNNYVTVSRNGMVQNGQLIQLQTLVREFQIFKKLRKIDYFKNFHAAKYLYKWKELFKKKRFIQNRWSINKQLNLSDKKYLQWKIQIYNLFQIKTEGGWFQQNWIHTTSDYLNQVKQRCKAKLGLICYKMLEKFQLPISESTDLLNKVLGNLNALNINFEKKIRIQKQCDKFYKLGRQLELNSMQKVGTLILDHLRTLIKKTKDANNIYRENIIERLQKLDIKKQNYIQQKQKILSDSSISMDIDYNLYFNQSRKCLDITPSPADLFSSCISQINTFIRQMDRMDFKIIRTDDFNFIIKSVFKSGQKQQYQVDQQINIFRNFVNSMPIFDRLCQQLEKCLKNCNESFQRRINLFHPFLQLYVEVTQNQKHFQFNYQQIIGQFQNIQENLKFCQKLDEGQYFILGFLKTQQFKKNLIRQLKKQQQGLMKKIPIQVNNKKIKINESLEKHIKALNNYQNNPLSFVKTSQQIQIIEENIMQYSSGIEQIEKIQQFYQKNTKKKLRVLQQEKKLLNEIRIKTKNFIQTRQNNFIKYRKSLQNDRNQLLKKIELYNTKQDSFYDPNSDSKATYIKLSQITQNLKKFQKQLIQLNKLQDYYNLKPTTFGNLQTRIKEYQRLQQIWKFTYTVDLDQNKVMLDYIKDISQQKYIKFYEVFKKKSQKFLKDSDLGNIVSSCLEKVDKFLINMQTIQLLNSKHFRKSDFDEINYQIQRKIGPQALGTIKCKDLLYERFRQLNISQMKSFIQQISFKAKKEIEITQNLVSFNEWWKNIRLEHQYMEQHPLIPIFGQNEKLRDQIDEYMTLLINILNNKYGSFVRAQCNNLLKKMNSLIELLKLTQNHQQKFLKLFPILTSKYAQSQLSSQCKKFDTILNKTMKNIRILAKPTQNLHDGARNILNNHIKHFDSISHYLTKFLESKRLKFQRFYFLQDQQLLQVLVGTADQKNIFRMFQGIKGWVVSEDGIKIGVKGIGDQNLILKGWNYKSIEPQLIFKSLQDSIKSNLNSIVRNVLYQYQIQLKQLKSLYEGIPWMCLYAVQMILFTKQVQLNCFHENIPLEAQQSLIRQAINHGKVKPAQYSNYITMLLHLLHFTEQMRKQNVHSIFDFQWHSFLRFYYQKDNVIMRSFSNQIKWGGQYQGMWNLMVYTSDIRRAHICVLNNIQYANGVLLQGPSGTGKTESLKELARCTAKYCVIFNCSQSVNLKTISKLLSGLCYTASWFCLDQINRLTIESMSVIAKQIQTIRNAILSKKQIFSFMGKDIRLKKGVAIFSTMNPIYLKRSNLTQNIKSCFRIITVAMPDHETILQILLYGLKFFKPRQLAEKISNTFFNLSIQLSKGFQYDFGLRALKSLINMLSSLRSKYQNENQLLSKAFYQLFYFRLAPSDKKIFQKVIYDVFKNKFLYQDQLNSERVKNMRQSSHTGIIVFGPVSIKTTLIKQYCKSIQNSSISLFNPNSVQLRYLLGQSIHGRWEQGIIERTARQSLNSPQKNHILVLDSTIKSQIIQNFNTLLDQSKLLTLSNGTRLKIQNNFKIVMQTPHLNLISPSTITRCHIIYVSDKDVNTKLLISEQLPYELSLIQSAKRIWKIYQKLNNNQIRQVGKLSNIMFSDKYDKKKTDWKDNEILGIQKTVIFAIRLLGYEKKISQFIQKENSFSIKKNPFHFVLSYQRYAQGEFIQISRHYQPIIHYQDFILKSSQQIFVRWLTKKASAKIMQPIMWKGNSLKGKTKSILFSLKSQKYFKIELNKQTVSKTIIGLLLPQILEKKMDEVKQKPEIIIYLQNLHLCNEQTSQKIRFMMQNDKIFSIQNRQVVPIQAMSFVAQTHPFENKQFDRMRRHFSELQLPQADQIQLKNIYYQFLKYFVNSTSLEATIKNSINLQSERFCSFLASIYQAKLQQIHDKSKRYGLFSMIDILQRSKYLNVNNCKNINDFISFMFEAIRLQNSYKYFSSQQLLIQQYAQFYKGKFVKQYQTYLRGPNIILQKYGSTISQTQKKQINLFAYIEAELSLLSNDNIYSSSYLKSQVLNAIRILENESSHYCLIANEGSGRKTIFKLACQIQKLNFTQLPSQLNERQMRKIYFQKMKKAFETHLKQVFILDLKSPSHVKFLQFCQNIAIGSSVVKLFQTQQTDYMFANISDFAGEGYNKTSKSYQQVCQDYVTLSQKKIQFLIACQPENRSLLQTSFQTLYKKMYMKILPQVSLQSVVQSCKIIFQKRIQQNPVLKESISIDRLPKVFMKIYKLLNAHSNKNKLNNLHHFNFNQFSILKVGELFCNQYERILNKIKQNTDVLNKSIIKISEINDQLVRLQNQIAVMEPDVSVKRKRLLEVAPILQQQKKNSYSIKYIVQQQKKQIQFKNEQIETLMKQVEQQLAQATPLLSDAIDSIQTIKRSQLSQIKNNPNPHPLLKFTMENLAILLGQNQNWQNVRKTISDANLLVRIKGCQPSQEAYLRVKKRIQQNSQWNFQTISKISFGSRYLFKWIKSVVKYKDIQTQISKKKQYMNKLKIGLRNLEQRAQIKLQQLAQKQRQSMSIEKQYSVISKQLNDLQSVIDISKRKLTNAQRIRDRLQDSVNKWKSKLSYFKQVRSYLSSYCLLMCLQITIFPSLTNQQLNVLKKEVVKTLSQQAFPVPKDLNIYLDIINRNQNEIFKKFNHEDAKDPKKTLLAYHFENKPIIIDPDNQASAWLSKINPQKKLIFTKKTFLGATKLVEEAMRFGQILCVLIQGQIDQFCTQIIKSTQSSLRSSQLYVEYNKNTFRLNANFKLLFFCKSKNPAISLKASLNHQIINFQLTKLTLQQNLINSALKIENPQLYQVKTKIQQNMEEMEKKIQILQYQIIQRLLNSKKNLIDDQQFIEILNQNKVRSQTLLSNKKTQQNQIIQIQHFIRQFTFVCNEVSDIFMSLKQMSKISQNLFWDVEIFIQYFSRACLNSISETFLIDNDDQYENNSFIGAYQFDQYNASNSRPTSALSGISFSQSRAQSEENSQQPLNVGTSRTQYQPNTKNQVADEHKQREKKTEEKIEPSILQTKNIFQLQHRKIDETKKGFVTQQRLQSILQNLISQLKKSFTWQQRNIWGIILALKRQKKQDIRLLVSIIMDRKKRNLLSMIQQNKVTQGIRAYFSKFQNQKVQSQARRILSNKDIMSNTKNGELSLTQILILNSITAPERTLQLCQRVISQKKLNSILQYEELKTTDWLQQSDNIHPTLLLMGQDPVQMISQFLQKRKYKHATLVAMGEDQSKGLDTFIQKQSYRQGIFIIHNIHIVSSFIQTLIRLIQQFANRPPHKYFRLILISNFQANLPSQLTSLCHKYIVEQPSRLINKMKGLYQKSQSYIDHSNEIEHKLSYSLCLMHSIVNEMKKYGSSCWNFPVTYNTSDFIGSLLSLRSICNKKNQIQDYQCNVQTQQVQKQLNQSNIDYEGLRYLIGQICYVGKMSDNFDRTKMRLIIKNHFNKDIFNKNYTFWQGTKISEHPQQVNQKIQQIQEENPKTCGLNENNLPSRQISDRIFNELGEVLQLNNSDKYLQNMEKFSQIKPINHKLDFINEQISKYNENKIYQQRSAYLRQINSDSNVFNLKAFENPSHIFVSTKLEVAIKNNVPYDSVSLVWSTIMKEGSYGVSNLRLEGACIKNNMLIIGPEQRQITLYFMAVIKKRDKDPNKGKIGIPLYLNEQRGLMIGNYGENTNLLTQIYLDSKQPADSWIIRSTAFVAS